jgi:TolB-like protein
VLLICAVAQTGAGAGPSTAVAPKGKLRIAFLLGPIYASATGFADGVAEQIIAALSRCTWLFVIARNSSFSYKGKDGCVRSGASSVCATCWREAFGNRLRITGQLVEASSGAHIWADRFEGDISDVFDLQDRITESVVGAIEPKLHHGLFDRD